jgi:hypothetical protein
MLRLAFVACQLPTSALSIVDYSNAYKAARGWKGLLVKVNALAALACGMRLPVAKRKG